MDTLPRQCANCLRAGPGLLVCGGCRSVAYCDAQCQRKHRSQHKTACRAQAVADKLSAMVTATPAASPSPAPPPTSDESAARSALKSGRARESVGDFRGALTHYRNAIFSAPNGAAAREAVTLARGLDSRGGSWVASDAPPARMLGRPASVPDACSIVVDSDVHPVTADWAESCAKAGAPFFFPRPLSGGTGGADLRQLFGQGAAVGSMGELLVGVINNRLQSFAQRSILGMQHMPGSHAVP